MAENASFRQRTVVSGLREPARGDSSQNRRRQRPEWGAATPVCPLLPSRVRYPVGGGEFLSGRRLHSAFFAFFRLSTGNLLLRWCERARGPKPSKTLSGLSGGLPGLAGFLAGGRVRVGFVGFCVGFVGFFGVLCKPSPRTEQGMESWNCGPKMPGSGSAGARTWTQNRGRLRDARPSHPIEIHHPVRMGLDKDKQAQAREFFIIYGQRRTKCRQWAFKQTFDLPPGSAIV